MKIDLLQLKEEDCLLEGLSFSSSQKSGETLKPPDKLNQFFKTKLLPLSFFY